MSTRSPDHITVVNEQKSTVIAAPSWEVLGECPVRPSNYAMTKAFEAIICVKALAGQNCAVRIWDKVAGIELANQAFSGAGWQVFVLELSATPQEEPGGTGVAMLQYQFQSDGVNEAICRTAALEAW